MRIASSAITLLLTFAGLHAAWAADPIKIGFGMSLTGGLAVGGKPALERVGGRCQARAALAAIRCGSRRWMQGVPRDRAGEARDQENAGDAHFGLHAKSSGE